MQAKAGEGFVAVLVRPGSCFFHKTGKINVFKAGLIAPATETFSYAVFNMIG